jgi:hypothetical protein
MSDEPEEPVAAPPSSADFFDDLEALRLDVTTGSLVETVEHLSHVPTRKPSKKQWFRVHPDPAMSLTCALSEDEEDRETYLVVPALAPLLMDHLKPVLLTTCISRQGVVFPWPVPLPKEGGGGAMGDGATAPARRRTMGSRTGPVFRPILDWVRTASTNRGWSSRNRSSRLTH